MSAQTRRAAVPERTTVAGRTRPTLTAPKARPVTPTRTTEVNPPPAPANQPKAKAAAMPDRAYWLQLTTRADQRLARMVSRVRPLDPPTRAAPRTTPGRPSKAA